MGTVTEFLSVLLIASFIPEGTMTSNGEEISKSINKFSLHLYKVLRNTSDSNNICVSPISAHIVLAIAKQGAIGPTANEMKKVLYLPDDNGVELEGYEEVISQMNKERDLKSANKVFVEKTACLLHSYIDTIKRYFKSIVRKEDFINEPEESRKHIDQWVEEETNGKIKDLLGKGALDSSTRLVLVNAIYFKGIWEHQFDENLTQDEKFYVTREKTVEVKMMRLLGKKFRYLQSEKLNSQILEMPYKGGNMSMVIICPNEVDGLAQVESELNDLDFLSELYETKVNVWLPRFKLEETMDLKDPLKELGIEIAFSSEANFTGISPNMDLAISQVKQKTFIEVNEEGTEAAAATAVVMNTHMALLPPPPQPKEVKCNKPFISLIIHKPTGNIIFISRFLKVN